MRIIILAIAFLVLATAKGQDFDVYSGFTYYTFEQQIKPDIGDELGDHLYDNSHFGIELSSHYRLQEYISIGLYAKYDFGRRKSSIFDSISSEGTTVTKNEISGEFSEFWFGPSLRLNYKQLFFEFGYALVGTRQDTGRDDIPDITGSVESAFRIDPSVAYKFDLGADVEITDNLMISIKLQWQLRYYNNRGSEKLVNSVEHGTQNISPFIGVKYLLGT